MSRGAKREDPPPRKFPEVLLGSEFFDSKVQRVLKTRLISEPSWPLHCLGAASFVNRCKDAASWRFFAVVFNRDPEFASTLLVAVTEYFEARKKVRPSVDEALLEGVYLRRERGPIELRRSIVLGKNYSGPRGFLSWKEVAASVSKQIGYEVDEAYLMKSIWPRLRDKRAPVLKTWEKHLAAYRPLQLNELVAFSASGRV